MNSRVATALAACAVLFACASVHAADPAPAPVQAAGAQAPISTQAPATPLVESTELNRPRAGEPAVQRTVIEDKLSKVEEVRVRGRLQKVTVDNKGHAPNYEVLTHDGSRDVADGGIVGLGGAAGKRVWNVLRF